MQCNLSMASHRIANRGAKSFVRNYVKINLNWLNPGVKAKNEMRLQWYTIRATKWRNS